MRYFENQKTFFASGKTRPIEFRLGMLSKLAQEIERSQDAILQALHDDLKKPAHEAILTDVNHCLEEIRFIESNLARWMSPRRVKTPALLWPARSEILHEPKGVVLIIGPWNYPFQLVINSLAGAIAAGCCAFVKPSELVPRSSQLIREMLSRIFPPEYVHVVEGGVSETTRLLELPFDHIFFTGSTAVGKVVMQAAAKNLASVTLELGGKSPVVVETDADLDLAARRIVWGKVLNAGQTCVAPDYALVHRSVKAPLLEKMRTQIVAQLGQPERESASFARIVNLRHHQRLSALLKCGKIFYGGETDEASLFVQPTLLTDVTWNDPVMKEEIFGPILPVLEYDSLDEAIATIRSQPKPLAAYIFTGSESMADRFLREVPFGGGCVNDVIIHLSNPCIPFGGTGASGIGGYHGHASFLAFSHSKSVMIGSKLVDLAVRYPPYTDAKTRLLKKLLAATRFIPGMRF